MPKILELPEPLRIELEREAEREGVSPDEHAALLLYIVTALQDAGKKNTLFQEAVKAFFTSHSLDADKVADVLEELVQVCLTSPTGLGKTDAALKFASQEPGRRVIITSPDGPLVEWRNALVHGGLDEPEPSADPLGWPTNFFEDTYGSLADDPIERLPEGQNEQREPLE